MNRAQEKAWGRAIVDAVKFALQYGFKWNHVVGSGEILLTFPVEDLNPTIQKNIEFVVKQLTEKHPMNVIGPTTYNGYICIVLTEKTGTEMRNEPA